MVREVTERERADRPARSERELVVRGESPDERGVEFAVGLSWTMLVSASRLPSGTGSSSSSSIVSAAGSKIDRSTVTVAATRA